MSVERTLSILKPDVVSKNQIGGVISYLEKAGLKVVAARMQHLTQAEAEGFYAVHRERGFFKDLVYFMTSGPVMVSVLEGEDAVAKHREIMGATDPKKAAKGSIRADFAGEKRGVDLEVGGEAFEEWTVLHVPVAVHHVRPSRPREVRAALFDVGVIPLGKRLDEVVGHIEDIIAVEIHRHRFLSRFGQAVGIHADAIVKEGNVVKAHHVTPSIDLDGVIRS